MKDIFIIGCKGIPAQYGGFETFVDQLTRYKESKDITYHVACMGEKKDEFTYQNSHCFTLKVPSIGSAKAVWYDIAAFLYCIRYLKKHPVKEPVVYVLACRIGPFMWMLKKMLRKYGGKVYVNPDGHEWLRAKWIKPIREYWRFSEKLMVKHADLLICDSKNIEKYIQENYSFYKPKTTYISYWADLPEKTLEDSDAELLAWYEKWKLQPKEYYLIVGRFVPENNYETMIMEFMRSKTRKKLAIISNVEENQFYRRLKKHTGFEKDDRIVFCDTVYESALINKIRQNAWGYLHGHEVGGTNPSLLEALGSTDVNLLLDVGFNREVGEDAALYWTKQTGDLAALIDTASDFTKEECKALGNAAKARIAESYCQDTMVKMYEKVFLD